MPLRAVKGEQVDLLEGLLIGLLPDLAPESLAFTNIDDQLWADTTAGGAWIYQGDWTTLPGYVQSWLDGEIE